MSEKVEKKAFRAGVSRGIASTGRVDRNTNTIYGYSVISVGEAIGHEMEIDMTTLSQVIEKGNAHRSGLKSRFGHPTMSGDAMGTHLGKSFNFRLDEDRVRADLKISDAAFNSPKGDLGNYVLELAEKDPEFFGASIVFSGKSEYRIDKEGIELKGDDGQPLLPLARVETLYASDVVDEAATGDSMFGFFSDSVKPSAEMTEFLDEYFKQPDAFEKASSFLDKYIDNKEYKSTLLKKAAKMAEKKEPNKIEPEKTEEPKKPMFQLEEPVKEKTSLEVAVKKEREELTAQNTLEIIKMCEGFKIDKAFGEKLVEDNVTFQVAKDNILEEALKKNTVVVPTNVDIKVNKEHEEKKFSAITNAMLVMGGVEKDDTTMRDVATSGFSGMSLQGVARHCLMTDGVDDVHLMSGEGLYNAMQQRNYFTNGTPSQGSGDFVNIISNVLNKSQGKGWNTSESTFDQWVATGSLKDFKLNDIVRKTEYGDMKEIQEGQAPEQSRFDDTKEQTRLKTYGSQYVISRQAIVNDDLRLITDVPVKHMRSLKRFMNQTCYKHIYNAGGTNTAFTGQTMIENTAAQFNSTAVSTTGGHDNLVAAASGAAPSQATFSTAYEAYAKKRAKSPDGGKSEPIYQNIRPKYIITGWKYEVELYKLFNNLGYNISGEDSANLGTNAANIHAQGAPRHLQMVIDAEIDAINGTYVPWWLATDANIIDTVTLYTLNGSSAPYTASVPTATGDARGIRWVIEHDFAFHSADWRGMYCNSGAVV